MTDQVELRDFTKKRKNPQFALDGHTYTLVKGLSIVKLQRLGLIAKEFSQETATESLTAFFKLLMTKEDLALFVAKLTDEEHEEPLELDQAIDIMRWALEKYGLRPTTSSSDSSTGSPTDGDGTRSADGA